MPWIFKISRTERWRRNFQIRSDYVFHHCSSTWMFSHSVLWNAATLCARYPFHPSLWLHNNLLLPLLRRQEAGKNCFSCFIHDSQRYPIFPSNRAHLYLCSYGKSMSTHSEKQVNKKRNSFSLQSTLHSAFFLSLLIYLKVLIASNRRDWKEGNICMARRNIISLLITGRRLSLDFKWLVEDSNWNYAGLPSLFSHYEAVA